MAEAFDQDHDQYYEIYDSITTTYELTCNICGQTYEKRNMDKDDATADYEKNGFQFKDNEIICPSCVIML